MITEFPVWQRILIVLYNAQLYNDTIILIELSKKINSTYGYTHDVVDKLCNTGMLYKVRDGKECSLVLTPDGTIVAESLSKTIAVDSLSKTYLENYVLRC